MANQKMDKPSELAGKVSIGTYYDYYKLYGICTILKGGKVLGYIKENWPGPKAQPNPYRSNTL